MPAPVPKPVPKASIAADPGVALTDLTAERWIDLFQQLPLTGVTRNIAANSVLKSVSRNQLALLLDESKAMLYNDEHRKRIEAVLATHLGTAVQLTVETGPLTSESPAAWKQRCDAERRAAARRSFSDDALVRAVLERFGGEIQYDSIAPSSSDKNQ